MIQLTTNENAGKCHLRLRMSYNGSDADIMGTAATATAVPRVVVVIQNKSRLLFHTSARIRELEFPRVLQTRVI